jgi:hypothetical protein
MAVSLPDCSKNVSKVVLWCDKCSIDGHQSKMGILTSIAIGGRTAGNSIVILADQPQVHNAVQKPSNQSDMETHGRRMLAGCGSLSVGGSQYTFDNCVQVLSTPSNPYTLYYTIVPSGSGALFQGGMQIQGATGWAGFAFTTTGMMMGSNAVIVYPDASSSTGATADGYQLNSYLPSAVTAAKGSFPLQSVSAAKASDGTLTAAFSVQLSTPASQLSGVSMPYLHVTNGDMLGPGQLGNHFSANAMFGADQLTLQVSAATPAPAKPSPSPSPSPSPAASVPVGKSPSPINPTPVPTTSPVPPPTSPAPSVPVGASPIPAASSIPSLSPAGINPGLVLTPTTGSSPALNFPPAPAIQYPPAPVASINPGSPSSGNGTSACGLTVGGQKQYFRACGNIGNIGTNFKLFWSIDPDPTDASYSILSMGVSATSSGYISVGFPTTPGLMTGASAAILQICPTCSSQAEFKEYYLANRFSSGVIPDSRMGMSNFTASSNSGSLAGSFKVKIPGATSAAGRRRNLLASINSFPLIYASGDVSAGILLLHRTSGANAVDLTTGAPGAPPAAAGSGTLTTVNTMYNNTIKWVHVILTVIGWGILIPIGILSARYFKLHTASAWFQVHRAVQTFAFLCAIAGFVLGFYTPKSYSWDTTLYPVHRNLGIAATVLGSIQMISLVSRPKPDHPYRPYWYLWHAWVGRSAALIAIANIYYALLNMNILSAWAWISYTAVLGTVVYTAIVMEIINWRCRRNWSVADSPRRDSPNGSEYSGKGRQFISASSSTKEFNPASSQQFVVE